MRCPVRNIEYNANCLHFDLSDTLLAHLRSILDLEEGYTLTISLRTDQLGIDSLIAVEVRLWLLNNYRANVPVLQILSGITLSDLIDRVCGDLPQDLVPAMELADSGKQDRGDLSSEITDYTPDNFISISDSVEVTPSSSPTSVSLPIQVEKAIITERNPDESIGDGALPLTHREIAMPSSYRTGQASYSQSMFWFVDALMEEKTTMNHTLLYQISGNLRSQDLGRAVLLLSERHEILRTRFYIQKDTGYLLQEVLREGPLRLEGRSVSSDTDVHAAYSELTHHVYDLDAAKSIHMILLSTSLGKQFLLVGYHHIVTDGASHFIMMADLQKSYNQESFKIKTPLQYLDYTEHEHRQATSNAWQSEIEYWKAILTPIPEPLPSHRSYLSRRQPLHQHRVHMAELTIGADIASRIRKLARTYQATAFHVYLTALKALLYRFLGVEDVCIGIGEANRWEEGMQDSMGPYINLIPLRLSASTDESFHAAIENSRSVTYEALAHARLPFEVLLNELRVARPATHSPIFQAFMDYRQETRPVESFGDCEMKLVKWEVGKLPYDIFLDVNPSPTGEVVIQVMVQASLYTQQDAIILSEVYEDILAEMVITPTKVIGDEWKFRQEKINESMDLGRGMSGLDACEFVLVLGANSSDLFE
jgi:hybrid polyketide synthase/nonribosomal peptide synthetase ACE1